MLSNFSYAGPSAWDTHSSLASWGTLLRQMLPPPKEPSLTLLFACLPFPSITPSDELFTLTSIPPLKLLYVITLDVALEYTFLEVSCFPKHLVNKSLPFEDC